MLKRKVNLEEKSAAHECLFLSFFLGLVYLSLATILREEFTLLSI